MDEHFPQVNTALQPHKMGDLFQERLFTGAVPRITDCVLDEVRYKPGKSCILSYRLRLHTPASNVSQDQIISARLLPIGTHGVEPCYADADQDRPSLYFDGGAMLYWLFPQDRKLQALPQLLDSDTLPLTIAPKLAPLGFGNDDRLLSVKPAVGHYIPERSCIVRYEVAWKSSLRKLAHTAVVFGKIYADETGRSTYDAMQGLAGQWSRGAKPLAYDTATRTLWQAQVPGDPLTWAQLATTDGRAGVVQDIAECVADLQACTAYPEDRFTVPDIIRDLDKTVRLARKSIPELAIRIQCVVESLLRSQALSAISGQTTLLHRDLKLLNFIYDGHRVRLIDLDTLALGDPLSDVGSLAANLYLQGIRAGTDPVLVDRVVESFVGFYSQRVSYSVAAWRWHTAAALLHEVLRRGLRQRDGDRMALFDTFVSLSERYCAGL
jgi:hypothetical protein